MNVERADADRAGERTRRSNLSVGLRGRQVYNVSLSVRDVEPLAGHVRETVGVTQGDLLEGYRRVKRLFAAGRQRERLGAGDGSESRNP